MQYCRFVFALFMILVLAGGCSDSDPSETPDPDKGIKPDQPQISGVEFSVPDLKPDAPRPVAKICMDLALTPLAFNSTGTTGSLRHDLVADFTLKLYNGDSFTLSQKWSGCESYIFLPDTLRSSQKSTSACVWDKDLATLLAYSPTNAHYFFIAATTAAKTGTQLKDMQARVDKALATLDATKKAHWKERLHVVATHADDLTGWMKGVLGTGVGTRGFAIDRSQRLRGVGSLADVHRYSAQLKADGVWPYAANMAYAAHEAMYFNYEAKRQKRLDAETVTEVKLWKGETIKEYAEMAVTLPDAKTMATFDTLELDVTQRCPVTTTPEFGNCGAWDYISHIYIKQTAAGSAPDGGTAKWHELGRLITTYHREGRWLLDMSPMLPRLAAGGSQTFKWSWAPSWNKQPTATWLSLRLSNRKKGKRPVKLFPLFDGGSFGTDYNKNYKPMIVDIPSTAKKVELHAIISGHGMSSTYNCAEFCNHQHQFTVNGTKFLQQYAMAGNKDGCMKSIDKGTVPNQWGTWWLGRGGWCPGQQVEPYEVDLTSVAPAGKKVTISYAGMYNDSSSLSVAKMGTITMKSYLVIHE